MRIQTKRADRALRVVKAYICLGFFLSVNCVIDEPTIGEAVALLISMGLIIAGLSRWQKSDGIILLALGVTSVSLTLLVFYYLLPVAAILTWLEVSPYRFLRFDTIVLIALFLTIVLTMVRSIIRTSTPGARRHLSKALQGFGCMTHLRSIFLSRHAVPRRAIGTVIVGLTAIACFMIGAGIYYLHTAFFFYFDVIKSQSRILLELSHSSGFQYPTWALRRLITEKSQMVLYFSIGFLLPVIVGVIAIFIGRRVQLLARAFLHQLHEREQPPDANPDILLLRPFRFDDGISHPIRQPFWERMIDLDTGIDSIEDVVFNCVPMNRRLTTFGDHSFLASGSGALRRKIKDQSDWRSEVRSALLTAKQIILVLDETDGVLWELDQIHRENLWSRTLILFPSVEVQKHWSDAFSDRIIDQFSLDTIDFSDSNDQLIAARRDEDGRITARSCVKADKHAYSAAMQCLFTD